MRTTPFLLTAAALVGAALPASVAAQDGYFFKSPSVTFSLRAGAALPTAKDPLHRFFFDELTLNRRDFASITLGGDVAVYLTRRLDLVGSASYAQITKDSEFRDWVDQDDLPIEQTTKLKRTPVLVGFRVFPWERGQSVGKFAWIPSSLLPYAGGGVGFMWYELEQEGWFVDHDDLDIFADTFLASGTVPLFSGFAGAEWWPAARLGLTLEGRFSHARARLLGDFRAFNHIDLGGFQLVAGISTRF